MPRNNRTRRPTTAFVHLRLRSDASVVLRLHSPELAAAAASQATSRRAAAAPYVCEAFVNGRLCAAGAECGDVHVDVSAATVLHPHTTSMAGDAARPRLGRRGEQIRVAAPAAEGEAVSEPLGIDAAECLLTDVPAGGAEGPRAQPLSVCAHFAQKGVCDFGATCRFVHALPSVFSASKSKKRGHRLGAAALAVSASMGAWTGEDSQEVTPGQPTPPLAGSLPAAASSHLLSPKNTATAAACSAPKTPLSAAAATPPSAAEAEPVQRRFRHEPYGARGWVAAAPATKRVG